MKVSRLEIAVAIIFALAVIAFYVLPFFGVFVIPPDMMGDSLGYD